MTSYYIASCVFTAQFPALSARIQDYVRGRFGFSVVRCCFPRYKLAEFEGRMPEGEARTRWRALPDSGDFAPGDTVWSLCHNCNNLIEEMHPGVAVRSLWELIDGDADFPLPDLRGQRVTVQDCWRARERTAEQDAVRSILARAGAAAAELPERRERTGFCGASLYRPQPARNPAFAPRHYVTDAAGKFVPHTPAEQEAIMRAYCGRFGGDRVVCYCHYCLEGLRMGGADAVHLAELLFPEPSAEN